TRSSAIAHGPRCRHRDCRMFATAAAVATPSQTSNSPYGVIAVREGDCRRRPPESPACLKFWTLASSSTSPTHRPAAADRQDDLRTEAPLSDAAPGLDSRFAPRLADWSPNPCLAGWS